MIKKQNGSASSAARFSVMLVNLASMPRANEQGMRGRSGLLPHRPPFHLRRQSQSLPLTCSRHAQALGMCCMHVKNAMKRLQQFVATAAINCSVVHVISTSIRRANAQNTRAHLGAHLLLQPQRSPLVSARSAMKTWPLGNARSASKSSAVSARRTFTGKERGPCIQGASTCT